MNENKQSKVLSQTPIEIDGFPFTIVTFETEASYLVISYLRNMPVSHKYEIEFNSFPKGSEVAEEKLRGMQDLARKDLGNGLYRMWIVHWASQ